ncbi:hypothetical protein [Qipengyuania sp. JC766]|uniref:hypothetical protein n=1 Tax=Qipengyuania sp. JC766 TaxID=3232139 RepID=UPI00345A4149
MSDSDAENVVRWRGGCLIVLLLLLVPTTGFLFWAAFDPTLLGDGPSNRAGRFFDAVSAMRWRGVSLPLLVLALGLVWEVYRTVRKLARPYALRYSDVGLIFYSQSRRKIVAGADVRSVRHKQSALSSDLIISVRGSGTRRVRNVDESDARAFVEWFDERKK